jgi:predicted RND superfamily exporter protein
MIWLGIGVVIGVLVSVVVGIFLLVHYLANTWNP